MILNPKIFRAYDIRGEAFVDFDEDGYFVIAQAFGQYMTQKHQGLTNPKVFVSGDGRLSMPQLYPAVIAGLEAANCTVTWGGSVPTPLNYFAFHEGNFDAALQISASHNPSQDNGIKMCDRNGAVCGDEIQIIRKLAECSDCRITTDFGSCAENCKPQDYLPAYEAKLKEITAEQTPMKIVVDAGNAIPGSFYPDILRSFGHEVTELHCALDASFPNHQPDPERAENCADAIAKVKEIGADLGLVFDGDGDRVGIILSDGTLLNADKIMYCLAQDFLSRNAGASIVVDAMTSATLIEKIKAMGGDVILSKTGHSYIEEAMHEHGAKLGGEQSGHFMFGENFYGHDDAILASLRFVAAVENTPSLIQDVTTGWPDLLEFSEKITTEDERKFEILDNVVTELLKIYPEASTIDGIRIDWEDGEWAIIRCSNTSPKIAVRIEAKDEASLEEKKEILVGTLHKIAS